MIMSHHAAVTAIGSSVPERILDNKALEQMIDTSDEWIVQRTGIKERRIASEDQFTSHLCANAVAHMMKQYNKEVRDCDFIIACTHTPDLPFPMVSSMLQSRFGIEQAGAMDLNATCAGFVYGLHLADTMIRSGMHRKILVVAGDTMSKITDYTDRTTCILFGDGAGAALVERQPESGFLGYHFDTDGNGGSLVYRTGLAKNLNGNPLKDSGLFVQNGREVYKWAVTTVPAGMRKVAENSGLELEDVDWFIPHSANLRMIESICEKSGFPMDRTLYSLVHYGNTSAATIPLAWDQAVRDGKIKPGDRVMLYGFGGGLVQAGLLIRWGGLPVKFAK
ncbi:MULTISPECIES: ketoacyl-ACP synthase III [Paenibacillus]|uniref:Beta-ketoacyl-[acyl-carrier-protein] synthase III n=1 Tax=Paenibacillus residui TaxID=629724 RepID=A0ABW3D9U2_9BACL|nr:ketoacyl-ACP synthase III [Paenibacillus sp. 32O-W]